MSSADIALLLGQLVAAWCIGFAAGYTLTQFQRAVNDVSRS